MHLLQMQSKPILALLLGAGFSAGFGIPTTAGLRELLLHPCEDPKYQFWNLIHFDSYPLSAFRNGEINDIELFLSLWEGYRTQLDEAGLSNTEYWGSYRCFLENFCHHLSGLGRTAESKPLFDPMVKWIKTVAAKYDVRIVTLNYDLVLERLCMNAGVEWNYTGLGAA